MSKINTYSTSIEKNSVFDRVEISNFYDLKQKLDHYKAAESFFRGQGDASWKLYTYAQREWINRNLNKVFPSFNDFVISLLEYVRIHCYAQFVAACKEDYDVSLLSLMQHYGLPTPLLDFTSNPDNALFFASSVYSPFGDCELNSYFSIYVLNAGGTPAHINNDLTNFDDILARHSCNMETVRQEYGATSGSDFNDAKSVKLFSGFPMIYMKETDEQFLRISNPRLGLQGGLFLYSGTSVDQPYETLFNGMTTEKVEDQYDNLFLPKIISLDVHKNVMLLVKDYLKSKGVNKKSLGLATNAFGKDLFDEYLKQHAMRA